MTELSPPDLLVASNRGPVSFMEADDGCLVARRGGGGLVSGLSRLGSEQRALWVCAALSDADRMAAQQDPHGRLDLAGHDTGGHPVRMLRIDRGIFHRAYNDVANSTLWFVHHLLYDTAREPVFDAEFRRDWRAYLAYNAAFAQALAEDAPPGARVLVQDYHLTLVPRLLRDLRPDLAIGHFSHTPWAPPEYFALLPTEIGHQILDGLLGSDSVGFHSRRWADAFLACAATLPGAQVHWSERTVTRSGRTTRVGVFPLGVDAVDLRRRAQGADVALRRQGLLDSAGGRRIIARVDRTELSKNIVRGLLAYRELLRRHPEWC
ncbi:MAG: trehalose-6-phosphate synthase, partial [Actinomycetes bacterium]